jgi:hypothetical protein
MGRLALRDGLGMMTALGYSGIVLMDIMRKMDMPLEPYFIDTGFHFPETLELMRGIERDWHVKFNILKPSMTEAGLLAENGAAALEVQPRPLLPPHEDRAAAKGSPRKKSLAQRSQARPVRKPGAHRRCRG